MAIVTTSKTYCDRPGCGVEIVDDDHGELVFSVYLNSRGYRVPENYDRKSSDLCKRCARELFYYWHAKKQ